MFKSFIGKAKYPLLATLLFALTICGFFFYFGWSLLYYRNEFRLGTYYVTECRYVSAMSTERTAKAFKDYSYRETFYCPRIKSIGQKIKCPTRCGEAIQKQAPPVRKLNHDFFRNDGNDFFPPPRPEWEVTWSPQYIDLFR